jgi:hypothetical protein
VTVVITYILVGIVDTTIRCNDRIVRVGFVQHPVPKGNMSERSTLEELVDSKEARNYAGADCR